MRLAGVVQSLSADLKAGYLRSVEAFSPSCVVHEAI